MEKKDNENVVEQSILGVENSTPEKVEAKKSAEKSAKKAKKSVSSSSSSSNEDTTYIMTTTHLSWGARKGNHFYAYDKPTISKKVMGKKHGKIIDIWLKEGWIKEGKY